ncbi:MULTISPECIES: helix-turn-helix transcriptional regulator [unclassified Phyllobacterium]|uniref:helix-turn-helix transcriptional regulator n=1 Tax=unclassified Phyllobacterium TaxID=2638441 RepID=UPI00301304EF
MELLSIKDVAKRLSIGRTALWLLTKESDFPKPVQVTVGRKAFVANEIDQWIASRVAQRDRVIA